MDKIIAGAISAVIGAFSAFMFNKFNWRNQKKVDSILSMEKELLNNIRTFSDDAIEYWSEDQCSLDKPKLLEARIKMSFTSISPQFKLLYYNHPNPPSYLILKVENDISKLYEHSTGGDFESIKRANNASRCLKIGTLCNKLNNNIRQIVHNH